MVNLDKRGKAMEVTWNDSDFTNDQWLSIGTKTREYREDGHPGPDALKYAVMDMQSGRL